METTTIIDSLVKLGSTGILAGVLWVFAKRFMDETVTQMNHRIDALERGMKTCEEDRKSLHRQVVEILTSQKPVADN